MKLQLWLRPLRIILGLLVICCFIVIFSDVKAVIPTGVYNAVTSFQLLPSFLKFHETGTILTMGFLLIVVLTLLYGRVYCSVLCPLGIMQDVIGFLSRKLKLGPGRRRYKKALNTLRYPILGIFIISLFFTGVFAINLLDPYANFGRIAANIYQPVFIFGNNLLASILNSIGVYDVHPLAQGYFSPLTFFFALTVFSGITLMVIFRDRLYCNTVCPVGTFLGLLSRISFFRIRIEQSQCTRCGKCQLACKANCINIREASIDFSRCVGCFNCISSCDEKSIGYQRSFRMQTDVVPAKQVDSGRRNFLAAGILYAGAGSLIASAQDHEEHGNHGKRRFFNRGPIAPPGSGSIQHLKDHCIGCQLCISSCPTHVLQPAFLEYGFTGIMLPRLDNRKGFCNFECTKCSEVCPTGAILKVRPEKKKTIQLGTVQFRKHHCIVESEGTACGSCSEHCPTQAVYMVPYEGDLTIPETDPDICVGCGACEYACPVTDPHPAIFVMPHKEHQIASEPKSKKVEVEETEDFPF